MTIADEAEEAAKSQHIKTLYGLRKMLCSERSNQSTRVLDKNGNLINSKSVVKARWTEHFKKVFKREAPRRVGSSRDLAEALDRLVSK